ncbi:hypothetical protein [Kineosporia sp. R_H_3]|uniref:VG15 protein n=1 Tax=Kineosporia sp. R_H_3 TaxID=1961848 RepID=UPI000B4BFC67|nr:hypothetical protein [Kineosporia sp. R_H_3]
MATTQATLDVATRYRADLAALGEQAALLLARLWRQIDPADPVGTWTPLLAQAVGAFSAAQLVAASMADAYVAEVLASQGVVRAPAARVIPESFAGTGAAGTELAPLLRIPAQRAAYALDRGAPTATTLDLGRSLLAMYARTEIADAGRTSTAAAGVARRVTGYVRALRAPSCARCAILAGRWYRYSAGFDRHPHCDCVNVPAENDIGDELVTDTLAAVRAGNVNGLSRAERQAIDLGADPSQVVNARDGMTTAADGRRYTATGTTRPGARILARDMARTAGAEPGLTYRNFTVSRTELARFEAQYGPLLARGRTFTQTTTSGDRTSAYRFTRTGRPSVEDILASSTSPDDAVRVLTNFGYLL